MKLFVLIFLLVAMSTIAFPQSASRTIDIQLTFQNMVGDQVLQTGDIYVNQWQEPFRVRSCKYYVSHLRLIYQNGNIYSLPVLPHLVNEADSSSKQISVTAPAGNIRCIRFLLGVDSNANTQGVQTGDLDPAKGMFWVWNTGYIMAKLEGTSPVSKAPGKAFGYDIGGFKEGENTARIITLAVPSSSIRKPASFVVCADVAKWFYGPNNIRIS